jgi:hypothetical protein
MDKQFKKIIKELKGHSGNKITLVENDNILYVEKTGDIERNFERMKFLYENNYNVPLIFESDGKTFMNMEYIHGLDMKEYLKTHNIKFLFNFIFDILKQFSENSEVVDYTETYYKKLSFLDDVNDLPFSKEEFIDSLPKKIPRSHYHGDFTLENLIYTENKFVMIDPVTIEYDSYIFDIAKLRQDLECKWFLRETDLRLDVKLNELQERILNSFPLAKDDNLLILMLLRVYRHTKSGDNNHQFILKAIEKLWK